MVDRIEKSLRRLSDKEQRMVRYVLNRIKSGHVAGLDIQKLKGNTSIYRVRKGSLRIIYSVRNEGVVRILAIERRSDTTYSQY